MKVFQIFGNDHRYFQYFKSKYNIENIKSFLDFNRILIEDRLYGVHLLHPVINYDPDAFYTIWNFPELQILWAQEKGWKEKDLKKILLAQIEEFKPDVYYSGDTFSFDANEIEEIGQINRCMKKVAWFAAPDFENKDFTVYDTILTNSPNYLNEQSVKFNFFQPSYDPSMSLFAKEPNRPTDIFFYGQYVNGTFNLRNTFIDKLIELKKRTNWNIKIALLYNLKYKKAVFNNKITRRLFKYLNVIEFPKADVRNNSVPPYYGIDIYREISKSKIVFNAAVDFSGKYKVNMRNIETMGCGAHLFSDDGIYPDGLKKEVDFSVYYNYQDFEEKAKYFLDHPEMSKKIAQQGHETVQRIFSKEEQWRKFQEIISKL